MTIENAQDSVEPTGAASALSAGLGAWLPIEMAPKDMARVVILYRPYNKKENELWSACATYCDGEFLDDDGDPMHTPEFWLSLPEAPNVEVTGAARPYRGASVLTAGLAGNTNGGSDGTD